MVADTISTVLANTSGSTLGRMCLRTIHRGEAPSAFARSMNWRSFTDSTWLRTMRDVPAHERIPITMISSVTRPPGQPSATRPRAVATTIANGRNGITRNQSSIAVSTLSIRAAVVARRDADDARRSRRR